MFDEIAYFAVLAVGLIPFTWVVVKIIQGIAGFKMDAGWKVGIGLAVVALFVFVYWVWPTPYRYEKLSGQTTVSGGIVVNNEGWASKQKHVVTYEKLLKVNRFTGATEIVYSTAP